MTKNIYIYILLILSIILLASCSCYNNKEYSYVESEPIEIIYRNTEYKTIYVPKTYTRTTYTSKPYNKCEHSCIKE